MIKVIQTLELIIFTNCFVQHFKAEIYFLKKVFKTCLVLNIIISLLVVFNLCTLIFSFKIRIVQHYFPSYCFVFYNLNLNAGEGGTGWSLVELI